MNKALSCLTRCCGFKPTLTSRSTGSKYAASTFVKYRENL